MNIIEIENLEKTFKVLNRKQGLISASLLMIAASACSFWFIYSNKVLFLTIGFISYYPCQLLLKPNDVDIIFIISPFMGIIFFKLAYMFWSRGARQYSGTGS